MFCLNKLDCRGILGVFLNVLWCFRRVTFCIKDGIVVIVVETFRV